LKQAAKEWLPPEIWQRPKRPYRAPIQSCFFQGASQDYAAELLSPGWLSKTGYFSSQAVGALVAKARSDHRLSETEEMALVGVISTQLVHQQFVAGFSYPQTLTDRDDVKICLGEGALPG
jgi:asparagine synthase (glutamine-hydrolysing)